MSSTESKPTAASTLASSTSILTPSSESAAGTMSSAFPHVQLADANDDAQVVEKVEQLLSRQNLANDSYLVSKMKDDMYIPLEVLVSSPGLLAAFGGVTIELERLKHLLSASTLVSLSADKSLIKPNFSLHRHTVILRDLPASFTTEDIQKLLEASSVDAKVAQIRCEVGCWFVAFESQEDAAAALKSVRQQKINGVSVAARLKSESLLRSTSSRSRHAATAAAAQASSSDSSSTSSSPSPLPHHQGGAKAAGIPFYPYYAPWYGYPGGPAPHPDSHLPPHPSLGYPQHGQQLAPGGHPIHGAPVFDGSVGHPGQHVQTSPRSSATSSSASTTSSRPHTHGGHPSAPGGGRSKGGPSSAYGAVGGQRGSGSKPSSQGGVGPAGKRRTGGRPSAPGSGAGGKPEGYAPSASSPSSTTSTSSSGSQGAAGGQQRKGRVPRTGGPAGGRDGEYSHHPHHHHSSSSHPRAEQAAPKREAVPLTAQNFPPLSGSASAEKTPAASTWTKEGVTLVRAPPPQAAKPIAVPKPAATSAPVAATPAASAVAETPVAAQQTTASPIPSPSPAVQSPAAAVVTAPAAAAAPAPAPASTPVASTLAPATASPAPAAVATSPIAAPAATPSAAPVSAAPAPTPATPATVAGAAPTKPLWASIAAKKPTSVAQ